MEKMIHKEPEVKNLVTLSLQIHTISNIKYARTTHPVFFFLLLSKYSRILSPCLGVGAGSGVRVGTGPPIYIG
jgi:hypothetical protein